MEKTYTLSLKYSEMLFMANMMYHELDKLKRVCEKYKRFSETGDTDNVWIEKLAVNQGQYDSLQSVYQRLSEMIALSAMENLYA